MCCPTFSKSTFISWVLATIISLKYEAMRNPNTLYQYVVEKIEGQDKQFYLNARPLFPLLVRQQTGSYRVISLIKAYMFNNVPSFKRIAFGCIPQILKPNFSYKALARLFPSTKSSSICRMF